MDDDEAYMELVKSNAQGELSALEIGLHALECIGRAQGKKDGGSITGYAKSIGKTQQNLPQWVNAAEVYNVAVM